MTSSLLTDLAIAPVAGYVGTKVMEPVSARLYALEPERSRRREDEVRPGPPYLLAAQATARALRLSLSDRRMQQAAMGFHYGLAVSWAPVYAVLRRRTALPPPAAGLATGAAMSLVADELVTPVLGFSAPNRDYPLVTHVRGVVAHLAFGLAVAATTELAWRLLGGGPRSTGTWRGPSPRFRWAAPVRQ